MWHYEMNFYIQNKIIHFQIKNQGSQKLPVWVFIYGGRRIAGHVAPYKHGPHYIMDEAVIFITMTYRLGPLGESFVTKLEGRAQQSY